MLKHPLNIPEYKNAKKLAAQIENTSYDYQVKFLKHYAKRVLWRSKKDLKDGKRKLGTLLATAYCLIDSLAKLFKTIWKLCEPHMKK